MNFRSDINGLRAISVIAVVLFHFNPTWIAGGFAGVDIFFVISGFLMTGIIFRGLEANNFNLCKFYIARANRIIPPLAMLCAVLLVFGWFYLTPLDLKALGEHAASSMGFISNFTYWKESGYFDASSHEKWLLHTWSLSAEWQFYILYPIILLLLKRFFPLSTLKKFIVSLTVIGFLVSAFVTSKWPDPAYYLLPTRSWEMMMGGLAYLYPFKLDNKKSKRLEILGLLLIVLSFFLISESDPWPGYLAIFPVLGAFLVIQAERKDSIFTSNAVFNKLGRWSYSIYLWHWPIVVFIYYFSLSQQFIYAGILLSILLGYLSNRYIESIFLRNDFTKPSAYLHCKPLYMVVVIAAVGMLFQAQDGFIKRSPQGYQALISSANPSPYRDKCHISQYQNPADSCEYFSGDITWATFGDSQTVEIAYALATKLKSKQVGLKHFSFSACEPSYKESFDTSDCAKWYQESIAYILQDKNIKNVFFNHRYTHQLFGGDAEGYPLPYKSVMTDEAELKLKHMDELINLLAKNKENVYLLYPIPELPRHITRLIDSAFREKDHVKNIVGTNLAWYLERNKYLIEHFDNADYPANVHLINPKDVFCDNKNCYAVKDGIPLYFDDDHPSLLAADKLVELMKI